MDLNSELNQKIKELSDRGIERGDSQITSDPLLVEAVLMIARMVAKSHDAEEEMTNKFNLETLESLESLKRHLSFLNDGMDKGFNNVASLLRVMPTRREFSTEMNNISIRISQLTVGIEKIANNIFRLIFGISISTMIIVFIAVAMWLVHVGML